MRNDAEVMRRRNGRERIVLFIVAEVFVIAIAKPQDSTITTFAVGGDLAMEVAVSRPLNQAET
eukprot:scaffold5812_cov139-Skeletonema_menzelii.AAC.11